jgi:predicted RNA-binding protein with PUA-like domain
MRYWLMKSEPDEASIDDALAAKDQTVAWTGVRNYQARNNLRAMELGDLAFFYHTGREKAVVGLVEVTRLAAPDSTTDDPRWDSVWVRATAPLTPVTLERCRAEPALHNMVLLNNSRLSVQPVSGDEWTLICRIGGLP